LKEIGVSGKRSGTYRYSFPREEAFGMVGRKVVGGVLGDREELNVVSERGRKDTMISAPCRIARSASNQLAVLAPESNQE
jgi:hypothetical protein